MKCSIHGLIRLAVAAKAVGICGVASAAVVYTYSGAQYTSATGSYNTNMSIEGSLTLANPIAPGSTVVLNPKTVSFPYSFSDGLRAIAYPDAWPDSRFSITTNSAGAVSGWRVYLQKGSPEESPWHGSWMDSSSSTGDRADYCVNTGSGPYVCEAGYTSSKGSWTIGEAEAGADAGGLSNPKAVNSGSTKFVSGSVGPGDEADAFSFGFSGSNLMVTLLAPQASGRLYVALFLASDITDPIVEGMLLDKESISATGLASGNYIVKVATASNVDPPFTIEFSSLVGAPFAAPPDGQAPEPGTLSLLGLGLAGLAASRRHKR